MKYKDLFRQVEKITHTICGTDRHFKVELRKNEREYIDNRNITKINATTR